MPSRSSAVSIKVRASSQAASTSSASPVASTFTRRPALARSPAVSSIPVRAATRHAASSSPGASSSSVMAAAASAAGSWPPVTLRPPCPSQRATSLAARRSGATRADPASSSRGASRTGGRRGASRPRSPPGPCGVAACPPWAPSGPAGTPGPADPAGVPLARVTPGPDRGVRREVATPAPYGLRRAIQISSAGSSCTRTAPASLRALRTPCAACNAAARGIDADLGTRTSTRTC